AIEYFSKLHTNYRAPHNGRAVRSQSLIVGQHAEGQETVRLIRGKALCGAVGRQVSDRRLSHIRPNATASKVHVERYQLVPVCDALAYRRATILRKGSGHRRTRVGDRSYSV